MSEHPTPDQIMQVGLGFWASKTLLSAVEMELFTELARHPEGGEALRDRLGLHPRSSRDFLDALVALGLPRARRRDLPQHAEHGPLPGQAQALVRRRDPGDGQSPPVRLLGRSHRGAADRAAPERGEVRRDAVLRGAVRGSGPLEGVPRRDDRAQSRRQPGDRRDSSPGTSTRRSSTSARPRATSRCRSRSRTTPHGRRLRPARGRAGLRGVRRAQRRAGTAAVRRPATSSRTTCRKPTCS